MAKTAKTFTGREVELEGPNSLAFVAVPLDIHTLPASKVYQREFTIVERSLYLASTIAIIVARQKNLNTQIFEEALVTSAEKITAESQRFDDIIKALKEKYPEQKNKQVPVLNYTHPTTGYAEYRTPEAGLFLQIIQHLDKACEVLHRAYFIGLVNAVEKIEEERGLQRRVTRLASQINQMIRPPIKRLLRGEDPTVSILAQDEADDALVEESIDADDSEGEQLQRIVQTTLGLRNVAPDSPNLAKAEAQ